MGGRRVENFVPVPFRIVTGQALYGQSIAGGRRRSEVNFLRAGIEKPCSAQAGSFYDLFRLCTDGVKRGGVAVNGKQGG